MPPPVSLDQLAPGTYRSNDPFAPQPVGLRDHVTQQLIMELLRQAAGPQAVDPTEFLKRAKGAQPNIDIDEFLRRAGQSK